MPALLIILARGWKDTAFKMPYPDTQSMAPIYFQKWVVEGLNVGKCTVPWVFGIGVVLFGVSVLSRWNIPISKNAWKDLSITPKQIAKGIPIILAKFV